MSLHFLLDAYNITHQMPTENLSRPHEHQNLLLRKIAEFSPQGSRKNKITVVFDGRPSAESPESVTGVEIIFARNVSADERIRKIVEESPRQKNIVVVTDDRPLRYRLRPLGVKLMSAAEFIRKISPSAAPAKKRSQKKADKSSHKHIPKTLEHKINTELEELWVKRKKK